MIKRGIASKKQVFADRIKYIGKESDNLDYATVLGIDPKIT